MPPSKWSRRLALAALMGVVVGGGGLATRGADVGAAEPPAAPAPGPRALPELPYPLGFDLPGTRARVAWRATVLAAGSFDEATRASIERGRALFVKVFSPGEGLGPYHNERSCAGCHGVPQVLGHGLPAQASRIFVGARLPDDSVPSTLARLQPSLTLAGHPPFPMPPDFALTGIRVPPQLAGLGWIEAVPAEQIRARGKLARPEPGRHLVPMGWLAEKQEAGAGSLRFGLRPGVATIDEFITGALHNELGLTTDAPPNFDRDGDGVRDPEVTNLAVIDLANFVAFSPPPARPLPERFAGGLRLFRQVGCADCHWSSFSVGGKATPQLYSDLLVHDVGAALADRRPVESTPPVYARTTPLWAMHLHRGPFLHDGSATTLNDAVRRHAGEASGSRTAFARLPARERAALLAAVSEL